MDSQSPPLAAHDSQRFAARVRSAVAWRWGTQVIAQLITWSSTILVVRLLDPSDYGLFAMSQVVLTALAFLNGHSFATSLVQTRELNDRRIGQVFALLLMLNAALALIQWLIAPKAAAYFGEPLVATMLRVQAVIFLTIPFTALPSELLARRLEFRRQGQVNMASAVVGASVALALAWLGHGVWALVYAPIAMFTVRAIGLTIAARLKLRPVFDLRGARDLIGFGGTLTLCQLFWIIQSQSDIVIAGRVLPTHDLGLYSEALFLVLIVTARFIPPINDVALAAYSELVRAGEPLGPYFLKTARSVMLLCVPIFLGLYLTAEDAILTLFGAKWAQMAPIVRLLALAMPFFALHLICSPATNATGNARIYLATSIAGAVIMPIGFLWGVEGGVLGLARAWQFCAPLLLAVTLTLTMPKIGVSPFALARELASVVGASAIMVAAVIAGEAMWPSNEPALSLLRDATLGAASYFAALAVFWPRVLRETYAMLRG